uniref:Uncharacterized protein n=2 Tax=Neisseria meningitidis TaxID=487 RepID=C6SMB8_NEIME|nr:hypothetical protein predicted by Glimmer/Critica [Neisseria meningitidis alpha275]CCA45500.1 hypothetical protein NMALPHA522_1959 [Neisseria meningitidis alpha522]
MGGIFNVQAAFRFFAASVLASQKLCFLRKLRFQTTFQFSVHTGFVKALSALM